MTPTPLQRLADLLMQAPRLYRLHRSMYRPRWWALRTAIRQAWHW